MAAADDARQRLASEIREGKKNLSREDMSGMQLFDTDMSKTELLGANLTGCDFTHCDLTGADLTKAKLTDSRLWNSDLTGANLTEADMKGADLWNARLFGAKIWRADLTGARSLSIRNFSKDGSASWEARIDESGALAAEDSYRALKNYFMQNGMYNDASWASYKEKTMERIIMKSNKDLHYIPSLFMGLVCGYGERPHRIVISALLTIVFFALFNCVFDGVQSSVDHSYTLGWIDYIYYSTVTFTTVGYGDLIPKPLPLFRLSAALEAFLGVFLTGLFIFTLARKYSAR
jgi:predicted secreted protein